MVRPNRLAIAGGFLAGLAALLPVQAGEFDPVLPADFLPGGILGLQIGSPWATARRNPSLVFRRCQGSRKPSDAFDEVCFFKTASRVAGAAIRDGFIVRKGDRMVLIGTGLVIKNLDDPVAEAVMRDFQNQVHAKFQQTGDDVLFVNLPERRMSAQELAGLSRMAPVLLVELQPEETELTVFYGYLGTVNAFSTLAPD
jgi:hypothetical protein